MSEQPNATARLPMVFDVRHLAELLNVIAELSTYLHPGTSHSEPGDDAALERAERILKRYRFVATGTTEACQCICGCKETTSTLPLCSACSVKAFRAEGAGHGFRSTTGTTEP